MMARTSICTNQARKFLSQLNEDVVYNISDSGLRLGFQVQRPTWFENISLDEYFLIRVLQELDSSITNTAVYYDLEVWDEDFYDGLIHQDRIDFMTQRYGNILWVPKDKDLSVSILDEGKWSQNISILVEHWIAYLNDTIWQSTEDIVSSVYKARVVFFMKGKYFDFTDLDNPVKFFIREEEVMLTPNHAKFTHTKSI